MGGEARPAGWAQESPPVERGDHRGVVMGCRRRDPALRPEQCVEEQLERLVALSPVLRTHAEEYRATASNGNVQQRSAICEILRTEQPAGRKDAIGRISRHRASVLRLPRRALLKPDWNILRQTA